MMDEEPLAGGLPEPKTPAEFRERAHLLMGQAASLPRIGFAVYSMVLRDAAFEMIGEANLSERPVSDKVADGRARLQAAIVDDDMWKPEKPAGGFLGMTARQRAAFEMLTEAESPEMTDKRNHALQRFGGPNRKARRGAFRSLSSI